MLAAVIAKPGKMEWREVPVPRPGSGQVLVQIEGCGVCASNLPRWKGMPWFQYPSEPGELGHEGIGRIVEVGQDVSTFAPGDRVAFLSNHAYAGFDVAAAAETLRLPEALDDELLPGEPLGCAWNVAARSGIGEGDVVAVVGAGFLGLLLTQLALHSGARVFVVSRRPVPAFVRAAASGAHWLIDGDAVAGISRESGGRLCDVTLEAAGTQDALDLAAKLTRERGRLVIAGYHQDGPRQVDMQLWNWRGLDVINAHERDPAVYVEGMRRAYDSVVGGALDPRPLLTHHLPLSELDEALNLASTRPPGFMKAIVHP